MAAGARAHQEKGKSKATTAEVNQKEGRVTISARTHSYGSLRQGDQAAWLRLLGTWLEAPVRLVYSPAKGARGELPRSIRGRI
jgi:hypothetical protein